MRIVKSSKPCRKLRPWVRAYAQHVCGPEDCNVVEYVPAQVEQILNFELGEMPEIQHRDGNVTGVVCIGGAQTFYSGQLHLHAHVESFAIFFQPSGMYGRMHWLVVPSQVRPSTRPTHSF